MTKLVNFAQCQALKNNANTADQNRCHQQGRPKTNDAGERVTKISTNHVERCMSEIQNAHHAEDQGQTRAEHE